MAIGYEMCIHKPRTNNGKEIRRKKIGIVSMPRENWPRPVSHWS